MNVEELYKNMIESNADFRRFCKETENMAAEEIAEKYGLKMVIEDMKRLKNKHVCDDL